MASIKQNSSSNNQYNEAVSSRKDEISINHNKNSFPFKLHDMLQDSHSNNAIAWTGHGNSFQILNNELLSDVLPKYFRHNNVNSFIRQLYNWDFRKVRFGSQLSYFENEVNDTDLWNNLIWNRRVLWQYSNQLINKRLPFCHLKPHPVIDNNSILAETIAANVERCQEKLHINLWQDFGKRRKTRNKKMMNKSFHINYTLGTGHGFFELIYTSYDQLHWTNGPRESHHPDAGMNTS